MKRRERTNSVVPADRDDEIVVIFDGSPEGKRLRIDSESGMLTLVPIEKNKSPQMNPLLLDVVLNNLFKFLALEELKSARQVCKLWSGVATPFLQKNSVCRFTIPKEFQCTEWSMDFDTKTKHDQFMHYLKCYSAKKLPLAEKTTLMFKDFSFINFQCFGSYFHDKTIKQLQKHAPEDVRSMRFQDDPKLRVSNEFLEINQLQLAERLFQYPAWSSVFLKFRNLQSLEFVNMPRGEIEKALTALETLIEKKQMDLRIRKLSIVPADHCEFHLSGFAYLSYVDLLKNIISLFPLRELHLASKLSGSEVRNIIESKREQLEVLILKRFVRTESSIHIAQDKSGSLFQNRVFPKLRVFGVPSVYVDSLTQVITLCPELTGLSINFQSVEICDLVTNALGAQVIQSTRAPLRNAFFVEADLSFGKNSKIRNLHWSLDERVMTSASSFRRQFGQFNFFCTAYLTRLLPRLRSYAGVVLSEQELRIIFENLKDLETLRVTAESPYCTKDVDIIGTMKDCDPPAVLPLNTSPKKFMDDINGKNWGIRLMRNLKRLYLENDNSSLSYDSFNHGFLKLPSLQVLHIRRAKHLSEDNTAIVALLDSASLIDVQIQEN